MSVCSHVSSSKELSLCHIWYYLALRRFSCGFYCVIIFTFVAKRYQMGLDTIFLEISYFSILILTFITVRNYNL